MNVRIKIPRDIVNVFREDLERPHAIAQERVGFLYGRYVKGEHPLILLSIYQPVQDKNYVDDISVGACINSNAIREVMQYALNYSLGVFHLHMHDFGGHLGFSRVDIQETARLIPCFQSVSPNQAHGALVFNNSNYLASAWLPETRKAETITDITTVGWPIDHQKGVCYERKTIHETNVSGEKYAKDY